MNQPSSAKKTTWVDGVLRFCLDQPLFVVIGVVGVIIAGLMVAPFDWHLGGLPRNPVPVDAIPDLGENQQIVFTKWMGRSPQDVEDQITYPLTVALLGLPDIRTVRSYSMFGYSSIYVIFKEKADFYDSRTRILEKLNSLPPGTLPDGVQPVLGPDATALGQIFWYTLEGRDQDGNPSGGWDLDELRSIQDYDVRYALMAAEGVAEVASVGGFVREYQVDVDPDALTAYGVTLEQVFQAVRQSNIDVGARTIEINRVEYMIRGLGFLKSVDDIARSVITVHDNIPVTVGEVAHVGTGPAQRRGLLDKEGSEAVGGVVVARYGENPLAAIKNVKAKIAEISPGLPHKTLPDGRTSKVTIVPFYDRTGLINETLGTLNTALIDEILITIIVVIVMIMNLRSSLLISGLLPLTVLIAFIGMKLFHVDANIVALSGIAIAIGTIVDMGVILCENILHHIKSAPPEEDLKAIIFGASSEVGGAVVTAVATTIISFLPVFTMQAAEGKLFKPLAYTKTFALIGSVIVALTVIPPFARFLFRRKPTSISADRIAGLLLFAAGVLAMAKMSLWVGIALVLWGLFSLLKELLPAHLSTLGPRLANLLAVLIVAVLLAGHWLPLGAGQGLPVNFLFVVLMLGGLLFAFYLLSRFYTRMLAWTLAHKALFLSLVGVVMLTGLTVWRGFDTVFAFLPGMGKHPDSAFAARLWSGPRHAFPGLGKEFMPPLDEGSFLYMPTTMPHASIGEAADVLAKLDQAITGIPEVAQVVGKLGRADSPLDPAPISMVETIINYLPEFRTDRHGRRLRFKFDKQAGEFVRDQAGEPIPDAHGRPYRQWRPQIHSPDDIWQEIVKATRMPGTTSAPKLQPIAARLVMLQSGMRAPMGVKIKGPDLATLETVGLAIEKYLKQVPSVEPSAVIADRIVGKPYLEIAIDRDAIARYGLTIAEVQDVIEVALGGRAVTTTVEGRQRYAVRVRYARELRDSIEGIEGVLVPAPGGIQIPLVQLATLNYVRGPQVIKSEDTFLVGYVLFDKRPGQAEVNVVEDARAYLQQKLADGEFKLPAGVSYTFAGSYENQVRSQKRMMVVLPAALIVIFLILYFQFHSVATTAMVFSSIFVAWSGGFLLIWLYGQSWFLDFPLFGDSLRTLFQIHPINLSIAVWVGFIALFGIASDDGVLMATYLDQVFRKRQPATREAIREATIEAAGRRLRPALMTVATTILALVAVLTSTGRGADIMVPMAIPSFGGMLVVIVTVFTVPVLYCLKQELDLKRRR